MPQLKILGFDGVVPRMSATMLGDSQAQVASNVKLYSRELRYWRGPALDFNPSISSIKSIYHYYSADPDPIWLTWQTDVDVCTSPMTDASDYRIYYTGDGVPKKSNYSLITTGTGAYPRASLNMGVPAPTGAPTATRVGSGTTNAESRYYVYTYVSTFGSVKEESAPSPPSNLVTIYTGDSCTVNGFTTAPTSGYNITHKRIYRTVTGATTDSYEFVAEIAVATTSYSDSLTAAQLGEVLPTIGWSPPPDTLAGLIPLPSGALAGFSGDTVYFSEPFYPHAWPLAYALNVPYRIKGLGIYGTSVVVMTERYPYIINGGIPGAMSVERVPILEPCVSKQSIVSDEFGVVYASPNGLVGIGAESRSVTTNALFRRDEWQAQSPDKIAGVVVDSKYFAIYPTSTDAQAMVLSRDDIPALSYIDVFASALHVDSRTGKLYFCDSGDDSIYELDANELIPLPYEWKSKRFVLPQATSFSCIKLDADFSQADVSAAYQAQVDAITASNATLFSGSLNGVLNTTAINTYDINGSVLANIPLFAAARTVQVDIYGDGALVATTTISSFDPLRLTPFKSRTIEVKITGNVNVRSVALATTVPELRQ